MTTTSAAFDPKPKYLAGTIDCLAASAILAGQVVAFEGNGTSWTVYPSNGTTSQAVVGVALHSQATVGGHVAVAAPGSVLMVTEGAGAAIDCGDIVTTSAGLGCVKALANEAGFQVGVALEDFAGADNKFILLNPCYAPKGA